MDKFVLVLYFGFLGFVALFVLSMIYRFVTAHERIAKALETIASSKSREAGKSLSLLA